MRAGWWKQSLGNPHVKSELIKLEAQPRIQTQRPQPRDSQSLRSYSSIYPWQRLRQTQADELYGIN